MRGFEVRDAERSRSEALVRAAHDRGLIGEADRDLRLTRVREAETPDELVALTRDLVLEDGWVPPVVAAPGRAARRTVGLPTGPAAVLALVGIAVAGVVALLTMAVGPTSTAGGGFQMATPIAVEAGAPDPRVLRGFVRAYVERFGTSETYQVVVSDGTVVTTVPVGGPRGQMWSWSGSWDRLSGRTSVPRGVPTVDLRTLDVGALTRNVRVALTSLGDDAAVTRIVVHDPGAGARVQVSVVDASGVGTLVTTPDGRVLSGVRS